MTDIDDEKRELKVTALSVIWLSEKSTISAS